MCTVTTTRALLWWQFTYNSIQIQIQNLCFSEINMSNHQPANHSDDPMAGVVHKIPWVLPLAGGLLIFLLAAIAVLVA